MKKSIIGDNVLIEVKSLDGNVCIVLWQHQEDAPAYRVMDWTLTPDYAEQLSRGIIAVLEDL